ERSTVGLRSGCPPYLHCAYTVNEERLAAGPGIAFEFVEQEGRVHRGIRIAVVRKSWAMRPQPTLSISRVDCLGGPSPPPGPASVWRIGPWSSGSAEGRGESRGRLVRGHRSIQCRAGQDSGLAQTAVPGGRAANRHTAGIPELCVKGDECL